MRGFLLFRRRLGVVAVATLVVCFAWVGIAQAGSLVAWGWNWYGQCDVPPGDDFVAVAPGGGFGFSLALKQDGSLAAWGDNRHGECDVPAGEMFVAISAGGGYAVALLLFELAAGTGWW